jgi:flavodoxin
MKIIVVYDSKFGNTARLARAIATRLAARTLSASDATPIDLETADMLFVGGPTQAHGISPTLRRLLEEVPKGALQGVRAAAFDTRLDRPRALTGAAAKGLTKRLRQKGASVLAPGESFLVSGSEGPLAEGELERATGWAVAVSARADRERVNGLGNGRRTEHEHEPKRAYPLPLVGITYRQDVSPPEHEKPDGAAGADGPDGEPS